MLDTSLKSFWTEGIHHNQNDYNYITYFLKRPNALIKVLLVNNWEIHDSGLGLNGSSINLNYAIPECFSLVYYTVFCDLISSCYICVLLLKIKESWILIKWCSKGIDKNVIFKVSLLIFGWTTITEVIIMAFHPCKPSLYQNSFFILVVVYNDFSFQKRPQPHIWL